METNTSQVIVEGRGIHFDPDIVDAFVECFPLLPGVRRADDAPDRSPG